MWRNKLGRARSLSMRGKCLRMSSVLSTVSGLGLEVFGSKGPQGAFSWQTAHFAPPSVPSSSFRLPTQVLHLFQKALGGNMCSCWGRSWTFVASPGGSQQNWFLDFRTAAVFPRTWRVSSTRIAPSLSWWTVTQPVAVCQGMGLPDPKPVKDDCLPRNCQVRRPPRAWNQVLASPSL